MPAPDLHEKAEHIVRFLAGEAGARKIIQFLDPGVREMRLVHGDDFILFPAPHLGTAFSYWDELPKVDGVANIEKVDPLAVQSALGYLMILDIEDGGRDFRYALYGSKIVAVSGFDMTGKTVRDIGTTQGIRDFFMATYLAAMKLRTPIYTVHEAPSSITIGSWHRLILPLGRDGQVTRFLVCNVPISDSTVR